LTQKISKTEKILDQKLDNQKVIEPDHNVKASSLVNLEIEYRHLLNEYRDK